MRETKNDIKKVVKLKLGLLHQTIRERTFRIGKIKMRQGTIFDIKEFATNDGPGIRLTVFFKGCPLRCLWCHNPEGLSFEPQLNEMTQNIVGQKYSSKELAKHILKFEDAFKMSNGGVTFSGGEALAQAEFLFDTASLLPNIHKLLDTSGFCQPDIFKNALEIFDLFFFDLKLINSTEHKQYTGVSNELILKNLTTLGQSNTPYYVRIPLIPDITDTETNLNGISNFIKTLTNKPTQIDLLPYNLLAGGKYSSYNMEYPLKQHKDCVNIEGVNKFISQLCNYNVQLHKI